MPFPRCLRRATSAAVAASLSSCAAIEKRAEQKRLAAQRAEALEARAPAK